MKKKKKKKKKKRKQPEHDSFADTRGQNKLMFEH